MFYKSLVLSLVMMMACFTHATIDLNVPQLEYIANHLRPEECRRLMAALEDPEFDLSLNLNVTEDKVPLDVPCLNLLVHWNSAAGEGKGKTHQLLTQRLKDIKHDELADWLSKAVFNQLSYDVQKSFVTDPLAEMAKPNDTWEKVLLSMTEPPPSEPEEPFWATFDSIFGIIIIILMFCIVMTVVEMIWKYRRGKRRAIRSKDRRKTAKYIKLDI